MVLISQRLHLWNAHSNLCSVHKLNLYLCAFDIVCWLNHFHQSLTRDCPLVQSSSAENNKDAQYQKVKVKAEPMEVDPPPADLTPPASHLLAYSTLGASEKIEPMSNLPETLARPQKDLFSQDISVKMASELLFKLSGMFLFTLTHWLRWWIQHTHMRSSTATCHAFPSRAVL